MKTDPHITVLTARLGRKEENYENQILITKSITEGKITRKTMSEMCAEFSSAPTSINEYEIRGKKYIVTIHYAGEKDIGQVIYALATDRAKRELGIG